MEDGLSHEDLRKKIFSTGALEPILCKIRTFKESKIKCMVIKLMYKTKFMKNIVKTSYFEVPNI